MLDQNPAHSKEANWGLSWQHSKMEQVALKGNSSMLVNNGLAIFACVLGSAGKHLPGMEPWDLYPGPHGNGNRTM